MHTTPTNGTSDLWLAVLDRYINIRPTRVRPLTPLALFHLASPFSASAIIVASSIIGAAMACADQLQSPSFFGIFSSQPVWVFWLHQICTLGFFPCVVTATSSTDLVNHPPNRVFVYYFLPIRTCNNFSLMLV